MDAETEGTILPEQAPPMQSPAAPEPPRPRRAPAILTYVGMVMMLVGLIDPLEGIFVIAPGAILVTITAFMLKHRLRWWLVTTLTLLAAAAASMSFLPLFWNMLLFYVGWMGGILALILLAGFVLKAVLALNHPDRADAAWVALALVALLAVLGTTRVLVRLSSNEQTIPADEWHAWTTGAKDGAEIELATVTFWGPPDTPAPSEPKLTLPGPTGGPAQVTVKNTTDKAIELPPSAVLDVAIRDEKGAVVYDAAQRYWGGSKPALPWDKPVVLAPGKSTTQVWEDFHFEKKGVFSATAEVHGGPLDGLKSEPLAVTVENAEFPGENRP